MTCDMGPGSSVGGESQHKGCVAPPKHEEDRGGETLPRTHASSPNKKSLWQVYTTLAH